MKIDKDEFLDIVNKCEKIVKVFGKDKNDVDSVGYGNMWREYRDNDVYIKIYWSFLASPHIIVRLVEKKFFFFNCKSETVFNCKNIDGGACGRNNLLDCFYRSRKLHIDFQEYLDKQIISFRKGEWMDHLTKIYGKAILSEQLEQERRFSNV